MSVVAPSAWEYTVRRQRQRLSATLDSDERTGPFRETFVFAWSILRGACLPCAEQGARAFFARLRVLSSSVPPISR